MVNLVIWLVVGGLTGWIASIIMRTDADQGLVLNVVVGIVGAALGGVLIAPLIGAPTVSDGVIGTASLVVALLGAVLLLAIVSRVRREGRALH